MPRQMLLLNLPVFKFNLTLICLFATLLQSLTIAQLSENKASLYDSSDPIVLLSINDFKKIVHGTNYAWLVEFYSSWCGHCIDFAPTFKALANDVKGWSHVIKVGAVNCANEENVPLCREYEVMAYPTLKFFPPFSPPSQLGIMRDGFKKQNTIRESMIDFVESQYAKGAGASHWPILTPLMDETLEKIWDQHPSNISELVLLFESSKDSFYWSREMILDASQHNTYPPIRRIPESRQDLTERFGVKSLPSFVLLKRDGKFKVIPFEAQRDLGYLTLRSLVQSGSRIESSQTDANNQSTIKRNKITLKPDVKQRKDQVYMVDIEKAVYYSLNHEVTLHKVINGATYNALINYVNVLDSYFPGRAKIRRIIKSLKEKLTLYEGQIRGEEVAKIWEDIIAGEYPGWYEEIIEWKGCRGSRAHLRGYPCSLWTLFHALTVNFALQHDNSAENPRLVLEAMKGYIKLFFGCSDCSKHFIAMTEDPENPIESVDSPNNSVLWLWQAHNKANKRLAGQATEDPEAPKIQFPSPYNCPECRTDADWNKEQVINYLLKVYRPENIVTNGLVKEDKVLTIPKHVGSHEPVMTSHGSSIHNGYWSSHIFTKYDISLCATIYILSSIMLLFVLCKIILKRRYRKKMYVYHVLGKP